MKNKDIVSSVVGAGFFGAAYLGLSLALAPALAVGGVAFIASELVISGSKKIEEKKELSFKDRIFEAKKEIYYLKDMSSKIDDESLSADLKEITDISSKIINRIEESHLENKTASKFMDYYLPVCVKIVGRYDEIENQSLTSKDSKEFMKNTSKILSATKKGFKRMLNSLYQSEIVDADAEVKVLNTMLTADGFDETILEDGDVDE